MVCDSSLFSHCQGIHIYLVPGPFGLALPQVEAYSVPLTSSSQCRRCHPSRCSPRHTWTKMASVKVFLFSALSFSFQLRPLCKDDTHSIRERKTKTVQPDMNTSIAWEDRCITHRFGQVVPEILLHLKSTCGCQTEITSALMDQSVFHQRGKRLIAREPLRGHERWIWSKISSNSFRKKIFSFD